MSDYPSDRLAANRAELDAVLDERDYESGRALQTYLLGMLMAETPPGHFANLLAEASEVVR